MKPEPKPTGIVCSVCSQAWEKHVTAKLDEDVTLEDCVRVLKAELAAFRQRGQIYQQSSQSGWPQASGIPLAGNQIGKAE
jgi:hypothetical protein